MIALFITLLFGSHKRKILSLIQKKLEFKKNPYGIICQLKLLYHNSIALFLSVTEVKQDEQSCIKFMRLFYLAFRNFDFDKIK